MSAATTRGRVVERRAGDVRRRKLDDRFGTAGSRRTTALSNSVTAARFYDSRMKPWRAALTSATASGKSTRIASRSAIACSSTPPVGWTCASAAAVSSTAVFERQRRELLALRLLHALGLLLGELAQAAQELLGIAAERETKRHRRLPCSQASGPL